MEPQKAILNADMTHHITEISRINLLPEFLCGLKSFSDFTNDFILDEALLHFKNLSRLLQELELLHKADISERDESTALLVEVNPGPIDYKLAIPVFNIFMHFLINHAVEHDIPFSLILIITKVILVKDVLQ